MAQEDFQSRTASLDQELGVGKCFDMTARNLLIAGRRARLWVVNGYAQETILERIIAAWQSLPSLRDVAGPEDFCARYVSASDAAVENIREKAVMGVFSGKTLLVDGATHGDETEGSEAIIRLAGELEGKEFNGTFVGVPALNMEAFTTIRRSTLVDEFNLNRVFPGRKDQYTTHYLAATYMERVVQFADAVISFHGGGDVLHLEPLCAYLPFESADDQVAKTSYEMAKAFNVPFLWSQQNLPFSGISSLEYRKAFNTPSIIPEIGSQCSRLHNRQRDINTSYNGIKNVMAYLGMIPDTKQ